MHLSPSSAVMVAGGAGFVGSAVVRELLDLGHRVVVYDNFLHGHRDNLRGVPGPLVVEEGDVLDVPHLTATLLAHHIEYVIDCVGDTFVPDAYEVPARFFDVNLRGTLGVLEACRAARVKRVLYVSTTEVYGDPRTERVAEDAPLDPVNTYAVSKLAADRLCMTLHIEHGVPVIIARIFNCYGPRETHPYIVPEIVSQLARGGPLFLGNVQARRDLTYVHDTARALIAVLESDLPNGSAVNVGSDNSYTIAELAARIARLMGVAPVEIRLDPLRLRRRDIGHFRCDNRLLVRHTDWAPRVDMDTGLAETIRWFYENDARWCWESPGAGHVRQVG